VAPRRDFDYRREEASGITFAIKEATGEAARPFAAFARDYKDAFLNTANSESESMPVASMKAG